MSTNSGDILNSPLVGPDMIWLLVGLTIGIFVLAGVFIFAKRWGKRIGEDTQQSGLTFSLFELREMYQRGELSDDEFNRLKSRVIDETHRTSDQGRAKPSDSEPESEAVIASVPKKPLGEESEDVEPGEGSDGVELGEELITPDMLEASQPMEPERPDRR